MSDKIEEKQVEYTGECPFCESQNVSLMSENTDGGTYVKEYQCDSCKRNFTTSAIEYYVF